MTEIEKEKIRYLRGEGLGYKAIAVRLGMSDNTVKGFCRRNGLSGKAAVTNICRQCGKTLPEFPKIKTRKFCCEDCRRIWWKAHMYLCERRAYYPQTCAHCGEKFVSYGNKDRKYCGHPCYIAARFGKEKNV